MPPNDQPLDEHDEVIDHKVLRRLAASWPRRATVRTDLDRIEAPSVHDPAIPDYPVALLPFAAHPDFLAATPDQRQRVLTLAWLTYNERVIAAEEHIANPAFALIMHGAFPGADSIEIKRTVQQAHIDETWHTYMHMMAMQRTRELRGITDEPERPHAVTLQRLIDARAEAPEEWERNLLTLVWTTVAEVSVNAYLTLLSRDETIQPLHSLVPQLHARDESAHSSMMVEVTKSLYVHMNREQRDSFCRALPRALKAFTEHD
ncbi:MAG: diiron oxygenase, partial [Actinomycetota bacterium]